jgi:hypothetical protein
MEGANFLFGFKSDIFGSEGGDNEREKNKVGHERHVLRIIAYS